MWESAIYAHSRGTNDNLYIWKGPLLISLVEFPRTNFARLVFKTAWVGFCNSSPQWGIKWQHRYRRGSINISCRIPNSKIIDHLWFKSKVLPRPLAILSVWCDSAPYSHSRVSNSNLNIGERGFIYIPCKVPNGAILAPGGLS